MAKRVIHDCDLCKGEFDPENEPVFTITVKPKGKKGKVQGYDICESCANKVSVQLASLLSSAELDPNWAFGLQMIAPGQADNFRSAPDVPLDDAQAADDDLIARKEAEREAATAAIAAGNFPSAPESHTAPYQTEEFEAGQDGECLHLNKSPVKFDQRSKAFAQQCRSCGEWIAADTSRPTRD